MKKILKAVFIFPILTLVTYLFGPEGGMFAKDVVASDRNNDDAYAKIEGSK